MVKICNDQKLNAKNAGDESIELFFKRYLKTKQSLTFKAVVIDIFKHMLNVVTIETGHTISITYKLQKVLVDTTNVPSFVLVSEKNSHLPPLKLQLLSTVHVNLVLRNGKLCGFILSPDLKQRHLNSQESSKRDKHAQCTRNRLHSNSVSEQEDDCSQTTSSRNSKKVQKRLRLQKKESARVYALKANASD